MKIYNIYDQALSEGEFNSKVYAYYSTEWFGYAMTQPHAHQWMEVMYVVNGRCSVEFPDQVFQMKKGEFIFINAQKPHRLVLEENVKCRMLNVEFGFEPCSEMDISVKNMIKSCETVQSLVANKQAVIYVKGFDGVQQILQNIVYELNSHQDKSGYFIQLMLSQLIVLMSRECSAQEQDVCCQNYYVRKAIKYIDDHYSSTIHVEDIASVVNIHSSYLFRIFKKNTGMTMNAYIVDLRIKKAKTLLQRTDLSVIDICDYVGFNSRQYFSYVFKKHTGLSPAVYRKEHKSTMELLT